MSNPETKRVVALCGGIGGAKLALGLYRILPKCHLSVLCNPGDDFEHLGLAIRPDFDTVLYTLADRADPNKGWGLANETWNFMASLRLLGGEDWFALGDGDLAIHVERTRRLGAGETATHICLYFAQELGVLAELLPVSETAVRTRVMTNRGELSFQHYFVREQCAPAVIGFRYAGADDSVPTERVKKALTRDDLGAIVICPSNPFISIDPILAVPGVGEMLRASNAPVVAVSPVVSGKALKGPTAKMLSELHLQVNASTVAQHYASMIDGFVLDISDAEQSGYIEQALGLNTHVCNTVMSTLEDREQLGREVLSFAARLRSSPRSSGQIGGKE